MKLCSAFGSKNYSAWKNRVLAASIGIALGMSVVILPCWWSVVRDSRPSCSKAQIDFIAFYSAARLVITDAPALYDLQKQRAIQNAIDPPRDRLTGFYYPPFLALVLSPLGALSFSTAFVAMGAINTGLLAAAVWLLIQRLQLSPEQAKWLSITSVCNYGVLYTILQGQTSLIVLFVMVLYVTSERGIWLGLLSFKPQLAFFPGIIALVRGRFSTVIAAALVVFAFCIASLAVFGLDALRAYVHLALSAIATQDGDLYIEHAKMQNLRGLSYSIFSPALRDLVWIGATAAVLALAIKRRKSWPHVIVTTLMISPHLHEHDFSLLVIPVALALKLANEITPQLAAGVIGIGLIPTLNLFFDLPPLMPLVLLCLALAPCSMFSNKLFPASRRPVPSADPSG